MRAQEEQYTLVGTHEFKKLVGGHRRRWGNNIKMDLKDIAYEIADYIKLAPETAQCPSLVNRAL
jgi:hypothetical protein